jgi:bile acid-coenzyme A ligase
MALVSYAARLASLADAWPDRAAVTCGDVTLTRSQLERRANRLARDLASRGVSMASMVTIALPNSVDWVVTALACWKLGATPQPVSSRLPQRELDAIVELADPVVVVGVDPDLLPGRQVLPLGYEPATDISDEGHPDVVSPCWKAPTSGGSTGRPKLILSGDPGVVDPEAPSWVGYQPDGCVVIPAPLYHNGPVLWTSLALLSGNHVVLLPRFDAEETLAAIEHYRAEIVYLVPTMMKRIWRLPEGTREKYDLSSLRLAWHLAEPCPPWLKQAWIDWLGAERIIELYGGTEGQAATVITGPEWLQHRGSVGRPMHGLIRVCDEDGNDERDTPTYRYLGAEARSRDGWESLGDVGFLDEDGYLYLGDRMQDMILMGGANVYPAEVEAALLEHPHVRSCAVIGLPDEERGNIIHAIVEADPTEVSEDELLKFVAERLVRYKVPRTIEFVGDPLRDDAGKVRRTDLRKARLVGPVA